MGHCKVLKLQLTELVGCTWKDCKRIIFGNNSPLDQSYRWGMEITGRSGWFSANHSGENLGKYFVGLCNHVGTTSKKDSKVHCRAVLDKPVDNS